MIDFLKIRTRSPKNGVVEIYPDFSNKKSSDLMIRGGDFYAVWDEEKGLWSTDEDDLIDMVDRELYRFRDENANSLYGTIEVKSMVMSSSGSIDRWHKYCQKQRRDYYHNLNEKLIFSNDAPNKEDYASKRLNYPLEKCDIPNYDRLMSVIYSPEEREKIEWAIGSIVTGDSKNLQKFLVLYGDSGTGKSTVLNIIQKLFDGYYCVFDAKSLGNKNDQFSLEPFKNNPLVGIQHDGDLSHIEDNTKLNSLVSHELMPVNNKYSKLYSEAFKCFLFMGTNKPVKITDAKSGILRRLIDVTPTGDKVSTSEYKRLMKGIEFELGGIAWHCRDIYLKDPNRYDDYVPIGMMEASNDFYNYILDSYFIFKEQDGTSLKAAWEMYKNYCDEAKVPYPVSQRVFKEEIKNYFDECVDRYTLEDGTRVRSYYKGFKTDKFEKTSESKPKKKEKPMDIIDFKEQESFFDKEYSNCPAQYAKADETPSYKWESIKTKLKDINTSKVHYVRVPENHIVIDFDIPGEDGKKDFEKNLKEASKWPKTYAELSKSGKGIHLHYIYTGDPKKLSRVYDDYIEIKVFTGNSSLRRKLTKCNDIPIANISSGLPLKGEKKMVNFDSVKSEKALRTIIKRNLNKEYHPNTKPSIDFIYKTLEDAYNSDLKYDVTDLRSPVSAFAASSSHQSEYCTKLVAKMHFKSEEPSENVSNEDEKLIFYDIEVFPNLLLVNWKIEGEGKPVVRMINPKPADIENLIQMRLVGFNCRRYDNHILWARMMGYDNEAIFRLSSKIVNKGEGFFSEAYNLSYTDVYDFCTTKQSLKKWEIELGIHHQELGYPWDQPLPEELWDKAAEYCDNDVLATEAVFNARQGDFTARKIQVELVKKLHDISNVSVNDTTNTLSQKIIFGKNKNPQSQFNYRDLSKPVSYKKYREYREKFGKDYTFRIFDKNGLPTYQTYDGVSELPSGYSILPFFPGYKYEMGVSTYLDQEIGEGGRVYSEPGMYSHVWDGDVSSMHPHSIIFESLFGPEYTKRFKDIVDARVAIKHRDFDAAGEMLDGVLKPFLNDEQAGDLAQALKIVINSIYGLTSASFSNPFRDTRNIDNIVAKRGALFMTLLKQEVEKWGYQVCHIKTDSIKIPNATKEIQDFVIRFGKEYGYSFETEADFEKFCLVNDAVYIAKDILGQEWMAKGPQFQHPYVFKKLFTREPIDFYDLCETKQVKSSLYLDMNEGLPEDEHKYMFIGRIGLFCPIVPGGGGGILLREQNGKYNAATGTKGYRWLESEMVKQLHLEDKIDMSYFNNLVNEAVDAISKYGDFEWFVSDDEPPVLLNDIVSDPLPESFKK